MKDWKPERLWEEDDFIMYNAEDPVMSIYIRYAEETDASILAGFQLKMEEEAEAEGSPLEEERGRRRCPANTGSY